MSDEDIDLYICVCVCLYIYDRCSYLIYVIDIVILYMIMSNRKIRVLFIIKSMEAGMCKLMPKV